MPPLRYLGPVLGLPLLASATIADQTVIWEQLPAARDGYPWLMSSQDDDCGAFTSWIADSFVGDGQEVTAVRWWGAYWSGSAVPPTEAIVQFWTPGPDPQCPDFGTRIHSSRTTSFSEVPTVLPGGQRGFEYHAILPDPFAAVQGEAYFVTIQLALCFPPAWGITMGEGDGQSCCLGDDWFGDWSPVELAYLYPYESAFILYTGYATPVESTTWAAIKAHFQPERAAP